MFRLQKGTYGYLERKKRQAILLAVCSLALVFAVYFGAYAWLKTNQNYFTIVAALLCLPAAKLVVNMILYLRAKGCSKAAHDEIEAHVGDLPAAYDLYMTAYSQNFAISHAAAAGKTVIAYTESPACDIKAGEQHIRRIMMQNNFHGYTVKIFDQLGKYTERLTQMQEILTKEELDKKAELMQLLGQISL